MARYPTFEEYQQSGNYANGLKRCDDLLKKNPNDVTLLTLKLQLLHATKSAAQPVLDQLLAIQPPISDLRDLVAIEEAVVESQNDAFPPPRTSGPAMAKLWDAASKASGSANDKLDLHSLRFSRAIVNNRLQDAQQALIQLKALQPRNRVFYMAHVALTQLLSTSGDDLQSKLALSLARKAVVEKFDEDRSLDCRVPGQVFAMQDSRVDLERIADRAPFKESKQVCDALKRGGKGEVNGVVESNESKDPSAVPPAEWLLAEVEALKKQFRGLIEACAGSEAMLKFAANAIRLFHTATSSLKEDRRRVKPNACFLSISALIRVFEQTNEIGCLLLSACLAEILLQQNPHIHEARMVLLYLYMRLGLGSLALRMWHSLSIKEIQHDTVGHALFTRLSLTHPSSTKLTTIKKPIEPLERLSHALGVYSRHEEKLSECAASVLNHGQTGMIFDLQELRSDLRSSLTQRIIHLERQRTSRLLGTSPKEAPTLPPRVTADWLTFSDNRDFCTTFNYGYNVEEALQNSNAAVPGRQWLLCTLVVEQAHLLAAGANSAQKPAVDVEKLIAEFDSVETSMAKLDLNSNSSFGVGVRESEFLVADLACQVLRILVNAATSGAKLSDELAAVAKAVERLNVEALVVAGDLLAESLVEHFLYLDVLQLVLKACGRVEELGRGKEVEVKALVESCKGYQKSIVAHAKEQARAKKDVGVKEALAMNAEVWDAVMLFGEYEVKSFVDSVVESAKEGWDGVTKVDNKVK